MTQLIHLKIITRHNFLKRTGRQIKNMIEYHIKHNTHSIFMQLINKLCVGFNVGGIPEMIDHLHNGYVAQYKSSEDFANGIYWTLTEPDYQ